MPDKMPRENPNFLAIDFETADYGPDSACAVGLVRVEDGKIVERATHLIQPPRKEFVFTYLHGISWEQVKDQPTFRMLWPKIEHLFYNVDFLAAHNAGFDQNVLHKCCAAAGIVKPEIPFKCSMVMARRVWRIYPTNLASVCQRLSIPLNHHEASSDAEACAKIMIIGIDQGK